MTRRSLALAALAPLLGRTALNAGPLDGQRALSFALPDSHQKYHDILDYRGKPLLLDFMLTACPHCRTLAAKLEQVSKAMSGKVNVLSIVTPPDTNQTVAAFIKQHGITSPILFDCGQTAAYYLRATAQNPRVDLPQLFLIDAKGIIAHSWVYSEANKGIFEGDDLLPLVRKLAATQAPK